MKTFASAFTLLALLAACDQSPKDVGDQVESLGNRIESESERIAETIDRTSAQAGEVANAMDSAAGQVITAVDGAVGRAPDTWVGKWVGVEGLALDITKTETPDSYALRINLLDGANDYVGRADGDVIRFTRDGKEETIRRTDGAGTGLKWLAEKETCLTIKPGEGFCRG